MTAADGSPTPSFDVFVLHAGPDGDFVRGRLLPALEGRRAEGLRSALDRLASGIGTRPVESSIQAAVGARAALLAVRSDEGLGVRPWSADLDALLLTLDALHGTLASEAPHSVPPTPSEKP